MDANVTDGLAQGNSVFSSDGEKLGTIAAVHSDAIHVEKGFFFVKDYSIPVSAIDRVETENGDVYLNVTKDQANQTDWEITEEEWEEAEAIDTPVDGDGYSVLTGAAVRPSPLIIEETDEPIPDEEPENV
jgi:hypothetical protein